MKYSVTEDIEQVLDFDIDHQLPALDGHFPNNPIVPAYTQLTWVEMFVQQRYASQRIVRVKNAKFKRSIIPPAQIRVILKPAKTANQLLFSVLADDREASTGNVELTS